jgi:histone H2B
MARTSVYHFKIAEENVDHKKKKEEEKKVDHKKKKEKKIKKCWKKNMFKFDHHIYKVLKQVHPNIPISCESIEVMNTIITKMMLKLVRKSYKHSLRRKKSDLSIDDINDVVMKAFPPQIAKLACTAARKALTNVSQLSDKMDRTMSINDAVMEAPTDHHVSELSAIMDQTMSIK